MNGANPMTLGERIRSLREERGWTISELSRAISGGAGRNYLYQVEADHGSPSLAWIERAAAAFGLSPLELLAPLYGLDAQPDIRWLEAIRALRRATERVEQETSRIATDDAAVRLIVSR